MSFYTAKSTKHGYILEVYHGVPYFKDFNDRQIPEPRFSELRHAIFEICQDRKIKLDSQLNTELIVSHLDRKLSPPVTMSGKYKIQKCVDGLWDDFYSVDDQWVAEYVYNCIIWNMRKDLRISPNPFLVSRD